MRWGAMAGVAALVAFPVLAVSAVLGMVSLSAADITGDGGTASKHALADIPPDYLTWYQAWAPECPGLSWSVVAAIGKIETDHGRSRLPGVHDGVNSHGAAGPMQFGIGGKAGNTWATYGLDGDGDGRADVYNPADAIRSAVGYLCAHGARNGTDVPGAIFAYNRASWYVRDVLAQAQRYAGTQAAPSTDALALLDSPRLTLTPDARYDLERSVTEPGWIDARVIGLLHRLTQAHTVSVSVLRTGHSRYVQGTDRISNHTLGRAVDIHELDRQPVSASNPTARAVVVALLNEQGPLGPDEIGSPFAEFDPLPRAFTDQGHQRHLHIGYSPAATG